ncbi:MAG: hypothetical protein KJO42_13625 [Silicimonas sp.]|nr:hypothetical protein [Silicimonas sp.]NNF90839.1 hypothetical protein [Boseongicola sp.]RZW09239.1 MAG: hypothetical protein EX266_04780 [Paracoccaceae bacterium]MBT8424220.1 hypothetical protein [Silicimonas sp.]NND17449.1 hypothetical protein [Silicimonas sp.]
MSNRKQNLFEVRHPFFRPLWRRVLVTSLCLGWALVELANGAGVWAALFGVCGVYLFVQFFIRFDPADYEAPSDKDPS